LSSKTVFTKKANIRVIVLEMQTIKNILENSPIKEGWEICKKEYLYDKSLQSFYTYAKKNKLQYKKNYKYDTYTLDAIQDCIVGCEKYFQVIENLQNKYGIYISIVQLKESIRRFKIPHPSIRRGVAKKNNNSQNGFKDLIKECEKIQIRTPEYLLRKPIFE
jgi:hypothetical protein